MVSTEQLLAKIHNIPDFPEKGVLFRDITPLLADPATFQGAIEALAGPFNGKGVDAVVAIEARGYILGAPIAARLGAGFVPVRKEGKLPRHTYRVEYALEYGSAVMEIHQDGLLRGHRVLIVDDVLATGGTLAATLQLVEQSQAEVAGVAVLLEIQGLNGREKLPGRDVFSLLKV